MSNVVQFIPRLNEFGGAARQYALVRGADLVSDGGAPIISEMRPSAPVSGNGEWLPVVYFSEANEQGGPVYTVCGNCVLAAYAEAAR